MVKIIFLVYRKSDVTREQCQTAWSGTQHLAIVETLKTLGLRRYVQNYFTSEESDSIPAGIGELWCDDEEAMNRVVSSPAMATAFEDAKRFADLDRTVGPVVSERVVVE